MPEPSASEPIGGLLQSADEAATLVGIKNGIEPPRIQPGYRNILQRACRLSVSTQRRLVAGSTTGLSQGRGPLPTAANRKHHQPYAIARARGRHRPARSPREGCRPAELTDLLEHPSAVDAGDLIGIEAHARSESWFAAVSVRCACRPMPKRSLQIARLRRAWTGSGVWCVLRVARTGQVLIVAALQRPVP